MSKTLDENGIEYLHGRAVEVYEGKIIGAFEMETEDAVSLTDGDAVTFILTVRTGIPKFSNIRKSGQLKCQNQFAVEAVKVVDPNKAKFMYDQLDEFVPGISNPVTVKKIEDTLGFNPESLEV